MVQTQREANHINEVANTIWEQLKGTAGMVVLSSWGTKNLRATQHNDGRGLLMPALSFDVNGLLFKGTIIVALDEGSDYYRLYGKTKGEQEAEKIAEEVCFDEMGGILDKHIERGDMSLDQYLDRIRAEYCA